MAISTSNRASQITTDCVYRIATGAWAVGGKLPSLRQGAELWSVDPLTVKRAYEALEARGLVQITPRSGVYVRDNAPVVGLRRHLAALEVLYFSVHERIVEETGLSAVGSFRYLARLAEQRASMAPECAFVECTAFQSNQLADEVRRTLDVPCAAITLDDLVSGTRPLLPSERTIFTTGFHHAEVTAALDGSGVTPVQVVVRFSASRAREVVAAGERLALFCLESEQGELIVDEVRALAGAPDAPARAESVTREDAAEAVAATPPGESVLASPSVWESLPPELAERDDVFPYGYGFDADAVRGMATAIGLPLGVAGCPGPSPTSAS